MVWLFSFLEAQVSTLGIGKYNAMLLCKEQFPPKHDSLLAITKGSLQIMIQFKDQVITEYGMQPLSFSRRSPRQHRKCVCL